MKELAEVQLKNIGLTGNINSDVASLRIVKDLPVNIKFWDIKNSRFEADINDPQTITENLAFKENLVMNHPGATSVDILGAAALTGHLLVIKEKPVSQPFRWDIKLISGWGERVAWGFFFIKTLKIQEEEPGAFIFYLDDRALSREMMIEENQFTLIEFPVEESAKFKAMGMND